MLPDHFEENDDLGMSNFDHEIDSGFEDAIKEESVWGTHSAWDFNGQVYYLNSQFHEDVYRYGCYQETVSADSLKELMKKVNARYGDK